MKAYTAEHLNARHVRFGRVWLELTRKRSAGLAGAMTAGLGRQHPARGVRQVRLSTEPACPHNRAVGWDPCPKIHIFWREEPGPLGCQPAGAGGGTEDGGADPEMVRLVTG
jgi:hypothetical protein